MNCLQSSNNFVYNPSLALICSRVFVCWRICAYEKLLKFKGRLFLFCNSISGQLSLPEVFPLYIFSFIEITREKLGPVGNKLKTCFQFQVSQKFGLSFFLFECTAIKSGYCAGCIVFYTTAGYTKVFSIYYYCHILCSQYPL